METLHLDVSMGEEGSQMITLVETSTLEEDGQQPANVHILTAHQLEGGTDQEVEDERQQLQHLQDHSEELSTIQKGILHSSPHCLVCNAKLGVSARGAMEIFSDRAKTSHRQLQVHVVLSTIVNQDVNEIVTHSSIMCKKCFKLIDDIDSLEGQLINMKQVVTNKYMRTLALVKQGCGGSESVDNVLEEDTLNLEASSLTKDDKDFKVYMGSGLSSWRNFRMAPKRRRKSSAWIYMEQIKDDTVVCSLCNVSFAYSGGTTNMLKHMRIKHPVQYAQMKEDAGEEPPPVRKPKPVQQTKKSLVWTYMEQVATDSVKCLVCNASFTCVGGTTNLTKHLRKKHPVQYTEMKEEAVQKRERKTTTERRKRKSLVWTYMEQDLPHSVMCLLCKNSLHYGGGTSNMMKHLRKKHPVQFAQMKEGTPQEPVKKMTTVLQPTLQETIGTRLCYKDESINKRALDNLVVKMMVLDLQPLSMVEDKGFKQLLHALQPQYVLPSQRELTRTHLPSLYNQERMRVSRELEEAGHISLTTDIWTSRQAKVFITVTAHFISREWVLKSVVLETVQMLQSQSAENVAQVLSHICIKWNILEKVYSVVTDSTTSVISAVSSIMKLHHLTCFAHTLNLVVLDSIKSTEEVKKVRDKVKEIVNFFHNNVEASDKLCELQQQHYVPEEKLIQDEEGKWTSTFNMMQRFQEQNQLVTTVLCLMEKNYMCLSEEELEVIKNTISVLEPFEEATKEMCTEEFTSLSKIIPMVRGLQDYMQSIEDKEAQLMYMTFPLGIELKKQIGWTFSALEEDLSIGAASLLDPRFKMMPFADHTNVRMVEDHLVSLMRDSEFQEQATTPVQQVAQAPGATVKTQRKSLWARFDAKVEKITQNPSQPTGPYIEVRKFLETNLISRDDDPLMWWKLHAPLFPKLQEQAKKFLCTPASSIPSERLFLEAGERVSQRRSCLSDTSVNVLLFLNGNIK